MGKLSAALQGPSPPGAYASLPGAAGRERGAEGGSDSGRGWGRRRGAGPGYSLAALAQAVGARRRNPQMVQSWDVLSVHKEMGIAQEETVACGDQHNRNGMSPTPCV